MPATPTSKIWATRLPITLAVSTASSATGMSLVPAETTRIVPFPEMVLLRWMVITPERG